MKVDCNFVDHNLGQYLTGSLDSETSQEFRWHLARCEKCSRIGHDALHVVRRFLARRVSDSASQYTAT